MARERDALDALILDWASRLTPEGVAGDLVRLSGAWAKEISRPRGLIIIHFFNHQTHHRGQVHAMLTPLARSPGTDLIFMPPQA